MKVALTQFPQPGLGWEVKSLTIELSLLGVFRPLFAGGVALLGAGNAAAPRPAPVLRGSGP